MKSIDKGVKKNHPLWMAKLKKSSLLLVHVAKHNRHYVPARMHSISPVQQTAVRQLYLIIVMLKL
jgi:hypothetical protein